MRKKIGHTATSRRRSTTSAGFTIVELLIVVVVIAILAAITIVSYNGITRRAVVTGMQSDLQNGATQLSIRQAQDDTYPNPSLPSDVKASSGNTFQYSSDGTVFCLTVTTSRYGIPAYHISSDGSIVEGPCITIGDGSPIQAITGANCPSGAPIRAVDTRDNHTYWVQKLADGKCWMLTNLAYAGGGTNAYGDTKTITNGTGGSAVYTSANYYVVPSTTNYTTEPTAPSTATNGTGQYGYLYNWCGAMGGQASTSACDNTTTPAPNTSISVCPAGWRLPVGDIGGEFVGLNTAINGGATSSNAGLRSNWLAQYSGRWNAGFSTQGSSGYYWTSAQYSAASNAYNVYFTIGGVYPNNSGIKSYGLAVRCVAN